MGSIFAHLAQAAASSYASLLALACGHTVSDKQSSSGDAASLSNLPPELIELIGEHVDTRDMCALRLVCRHMAEKVLQTTFTRVHFGKRGCLMFDLVSLQTLLKIAVHPVFGPAIKELSFYIETVQPPDIVSQAPGGFGTYVDWVHGELQQRLYEQQRKIDAQVATLSRVFRELQAHSQLRKIVVASISTTTHHEKIPGRRIHPDDAMIALHRLELALGTIRANSFPMLSTLAMEGDEVSIQTSKMLHRQNAALKHDVVMTKLFERLGPVSLTLQSGKPEGDLGMLYLLQTLIRSTALTTLELHFKLFLQSNNRRAFDTWSALALMQLWFSSLKTLKLRCFSTDLSNLHNFVSRHSTLEQVTLVEWAAIGVPEPDFHLWETAIDGGGDALTMIKNVIGPDGLESEGTMAVILYPGLR